MSNCQRRPKPKMWVPKFFTKKRKDWYLSNKYQALCDHVSRPETICLLFKQNRFSNMLSNILTEETNGLRIYLASYPNDGQPNVPAGYGNLITLIFSPTIQNDSVTYADRGDFYLLNPDSDYLDITEEASNWINNYQTQQLQQVLNKLYPFAEGDTKSIWYEKSNIQELTEEMLCQNASGIRIYLSSYTHDDDLLPPPYGIDKQYLKRLIIQFSLTRDVNFSDFEIDDIAGFWQRADPPLKYLDNGQLCPPTNCPR